MINETIRESNQKIDYLMQCRDFIIKIFNNNTLEE
jgi:hypothetical protein